MNAILKAQYVKLNAASQVYAFLTSQVAGNDILLMYQVPGKHHSAQKGLIRPKIGFFAPLPSFLHMLYSFKRVRCNSSLEMDCNSFPSILIKVSLKSLKHYLSVCLPSVCVHMCVHATAHLWMLEDNLQVLVFFLYRVDLRVQIQAHPPG